MARNQDDHTKNITFIMDKSGQWSLSIAYDVTYSFSPSGEWTSRHQMSVNGKRDGFVAMGLKADLTKGKARKIVKEVIDAVSNWSKFAKKANINDEFPNEVFRNLRMDFTL